jgi:hypothetical protein
MSRTEQTVLADREAIEALRHHPDLLALADAVAATQRPSRRRHLPFARATVIAAALAAAAAVALIAPWQGRSAGFVARALAALGNGQVIHVISTSEIPSERIVDLQSGTERPLEQQTEIWYDGTRGLERTIVRIDGRVAGEVLQTPQGAWSQDGRVYTCAWIAAHPAEATKARVSCNASGDNGTTPRSIPEAPPTLDPALADFASGYRDALANDTAARDGSGSIDGRPVEWLRFTEQGTSTGASGGPVVERVAVDTQTLRPVLVQRFADGSQVGEMQIATIETLPASVVAFPKPAQTSPEPQGTRVQAQQTATPADAAAALGGTLLWAGQSLAGLPLNQTTTEQIVTGYGAGSTTPDTHSVGVELVYGGPADPNGASTYVIVKQSTTPQMLYGFVGPERQALPSGQMLVLSSDVLTKAPGSTQATPTGATLWSGLLVQDGMYVSLEATSEALLLEAADALTGYPATK